MSRGSAREVLSYAGQGRDRFSQEYRIVTRSGSIRWVDDRTAVERDAAGTKSAITRESSSTSASASVSRPNCGGSIDTCG
jgi:hypothetical protein